MFLNLHRTSAGIASLMAAGFLSLAAMGAHGQALTVYSDQASFLAAAGASLPVTDFSSIANNTYQTLSNAQDSSIPPGVTFSANNSNAGALFIAPTDFGGTTAITSPAVFGNLFGSSLIATFLPTVTAVGTDLIPYDGANGTFPINVTVDLVGGGSSTFTVTPPAGLPAFFGVIGTGGDVIDEIEFTPPGSDNNGVNNFEFGNASLPAGTPEPGSLAMFAGLGVCSVFAVRRRSNRM